MASTIAKLTGWKVRAVPAGMWLTLKLLAVVPMFFTLNFCLGDVTLVRNHPEYTMHSQRLEVSGVVSDQLCGRDDNISVDRFECVHQARALLSDRLQRVAIRVARWDPLRRRLEQRARRQADLGCSALHAKEKRRNPSHERGRHRRAGQYGERAQRNWEGREDVPARRGNRGLEEKVVRGAEARETGDEAAGGVGEVEASARLRERDANGDA